MKVCDAHPERKAVDAIQIQGDGSLIDLCGECREAVYALFAKPPPESGASPNASATAEADTKAPKRGLSLFGRK